MRYCLLALSLVIVFASCDKGEQAVTKQETLMGSKWKLNAGKIVVRLHNMGVNGDISVTDTKKLLEPDTVFYVDPNDQVNPLQMYTTDHVDHGCIIDDLFEFKTNNRGIRLPGEIICNINETAQLDFSWGITDAGTKMFIYDAKEFFKTEVNAEIVSFYDDRFEIKYNVYEDTKLHLNGNPGFWKRDTITYHMEFIKQ